MIDKNIRYIDLNSLLVMLFFYIFDFKKTSHKKIKFKLIQNKNHTINWINNILIVKYQLLKLWNEKKID